MRSRSIGFGTAELSASSACLTRFAQSNSRFARYVRSHADIRARADNVGLAVAVVREPAARVLRSRLGLSEHSISLPPRGRMRYVELRRGVWFLLKKLLLAVSRSFRSFSPLACDEPSSPSKLLALVRRERVPYKCPHAWISRSVLGQRGGPQS
jgi:hypothetical protein